MVFVKNKHGGVVPEPGRAGEEEEVVLRELEEAVKETGRLIEEGHYDRALRRVLDFSAKCNQYFQHKAPWENAEEEPTTVYYSCNLVAGLATLLNPFLPFSSEEFWGQLGFDRPLEEDGWAAALRIEGRGRAEDRRTEALFRKVEEKDLGRFESCSADQSQDCRNSRPCGSAESISSSIVLSREDLREGVVLVVLRGLEA